MTLSRQRRRLVTAGVMVDSFVGAMEATIVATAAPTIVADLGNIELFPWVFSVFLLTRTIGMPIWGRLSDIFGRRPTYLAGAGMFIVASALAGSSGSMTQLIAWRALQGFGAGALLTVSQAILGAIYPLEQRAKIQGIFSSVWGFAAIIGPLVGGALADQASWRWIFWINVPVGLVATAIIGLFLVEEGVIRHRVRIDWPGAVLLAATLGTLLLSLLHVGETGAWDLWATLLVVASAVIGTSLVVAERRAPNPILPIDLARNRVVVASSVTTFFSGFSMYVAMAFVPIFMQGVEGTTATGAGWRLTPLTIGWSVMASITGGVLLRVGYRRAGIAGMASLLAGSWLLVLLPQDVADAIPFVATFLIGAGLGVVGIAYLLAVQNGVRHEHLGAATAVNGFSRAVGGMVGTAAFGALLTARFRHALPAGIDPDRLGDLVDPGLRGELPAGVLDALRDALSSALGMVFLAGAIVALIAFVASLAFPRGTPEELRAEREGVGAG